MMRWGRKRHDSGKKYVFFSIFFLVIRIPGKGWLAVSQNLLARGAGMFFFSPPHEVIESRVLRGGLETPKLVRGKFQAYVEVELKQLKEHLAILTGQLRNDI